MAVFRFSIPLFSLTVSLVALSVAAAPQGKQTTDSPISVHKNLRVRQQATRVAARGNESTSAGTLKRPKRCPANMAPIPSEDGGYCIDRYEGSLVEVVGAKNKTRLHSPFEIVGNKKVKAVSKKGVFPQGYISQVEAKAACEAAGKRLCTAQEWLRACRGKNPTLYPYGDQEVPGRCNFNGARQHPIAEVFGADMMKALASSSKMNDPRLNQLPRSLAKTGAHPKCKNSFGVFDMVGNLHEWVAEGSGQFNGGFYMDTHRNGDGCLYKTTAHNTTYHDYSTGFRCCK